MTELEKYQQFIAAYQAYVDEYSKKRPEGDRYKLLEAYPKYIETHDIFMENKVRWIESLGRIDLALTQEQIETGYHQGDCELLYEAFPEVKAQLEDIEPDTLVQCLLEYGYGAWEESELRDDIEMSRKRLLWIACQILLETT